MFNRNSPIKKYTDSNLLNELTADASKCSNKQHDGRHIPNSETKKALQEASSRTEFTNTYTITSFLDRFIDDELVSSNTTKMYT